MTTLRLPGYLVAGFVAALLLAPPVVWRSTSRPQVAAPASAAAIMAEAVPFEPVSPSDISRSESVADSRPGDARLLLLASHHLELPVRVRVVDELVVDELDAGLLGELAGYIASPLPAEPNADARERALRNHLVNRLREQPAHAGILVPALAAQLDDADGDPALRDYAAQHLAAWLPALSGTAHATAEQALREALESSEATLPGTSLLGLHDLQVKGVLGSPFDSRAEARRMALDSRVAIASRITALSLLSEFTPPDPALTRFAAAWASDATLPLGARLAAAALLKQSAHAP